MAAFYVYEHIRKDTGAVFYVGKGTKDRASVKRNRNTYWQNVVNKAGGFSYRKIVNGVDSELACLAEMERINQLKLLGIKLTNLTDGGEGLNGLADEVRKKMSIDRTGSKNPRFFINSRRQKRARKEFVPKEVMQENMRKNHWSKTGSYKPPVGVKRPQSTIEKLRGPRPSISGGNNHKAKTIVYNGTEFSCIKDFANFLNVNYKTLVVKIRKVGRTVFTEDDFESLTNGRIAFNQ